MQPPLAHAPYSMPQLMRAREAADMSVHSARAAIFATVFKNAVRAARACDANEFQLASTQLPAFVDLDFCDTHVRPGYEWSFTAATPTDPATLRVSWLPSPDSIAK
jgi:hypothetical protein